MAAQEEEEVAEKAEKDHPDHMELKEQVERVETSGHCGQVFHKRRETWNSKIKIKDSTCDQRSTCGGDDADWVQRYQTHRTSR